MILEIKIWGTYVLDHWRLKMERDVMESIVAILENSDTNLLSQEQKIQEAQRIKSFMDKMPGGFLIYHADGREEIIYANQALIRIFGCDTIDEFRKLTDNSFRGIVHPDDLEEVERSIKEQIAESHYDLDYVEYRIICKDGEERWIEDYGHFVHNQYVGDIFYVFIGDATEKKKRYLEENQENSRRLKMIEGLSVDYESVYYVNLESDEMKPYRVDVRMGGEFVKANEIYRFSEYKKHYVEK
ncbi:MAG: PAS domain-containing protein, partial [Lachnospiraceae bacterium]|nr:PAS domain-containing protein [Lachnospiraceae bacterium]